MLPVGLGTAGQLRSIEIWTTSVRLLEAVDAAHGRHFEKVVVYVRVITDATEGWGEAASLDVPVGTDPSTGDVRRALEQYWLDRISEAAHAREGWCPESHVIANLAGSSPVDRVAGAAVEMALLDAELRLNGRSMASWIGNTAASVPFGGLVGLAGDSGIGLLEAAVDALRIGGASRIRTKIAPGRARDQVRAVLAAAQGLAVQADANGSFSMSPDDLGELLSLDAFDLACIEQPLSTSDLTATAALGDLLETPICLDETITSQRSARDAIRYGACGVLCLKPGRLGGVRATLGILEMAREANMGVFMGGMFETGLGRAALGALAGHPGATLISDVAAPATYLESDPCSLRPPSDSLQSLHREPGIGPWPDRSALTLEASTAL